LACIFTGGLAHILACVRWFAVSRGSFGDHHLFCDAVTGKSGPNATEDGVSARRLLNALERMWHCRLMYAPSVIAFGIGPRRTGISEKADPRLTR
jgi:hypothetical protein